VPTTSEFEEFSCSVERIARFTGLELAVFEEPGKRSLQLSLSKKTSCYNGTTGGENGFD
jgi:hypothetical protein